MRASLHIRRLLGNAATSRYRHRSAQTPTAFLALVALEAVVAGEEDEARDAFTPTPFERVLAAEKGTEALSADAMIRASEVEGFGVEVSVRSEAEAVAAARVS